MTILVVEDHRDVADALRVGLEESGYRVDVAHDGLDGEVRARTCAYDLFVIDWMLPGQDGATLIRRLRAAGVEAPALMLTARAEKEDQIEALDNGADDYLSKPFSFEVLLARLRALSRRTAAAVGPRTAYLELGALRLHLQRHTAAFDDTPLELRVKEYAILELFAQHPGAVLTRSVIAERVWGNLFVTDDVLNTTLGSLRRKLRDAARPGGPPAVEIQTLRGVGYRLTTASRVAA
jgi:two-component system copper resistance phosphate regulon response regulator CusR